MKTLSIETFSLHPVGSLVFSKCCHNFHPQAGTVTAALSEPYWPALMTGTANTPQRLSNLRLLHGLGLA